MRKKILVTGSEGFIGSHLVEKLVRKNYKVRAFVQYNSFNSIGWLDDLPSEVKNKLEIHFGDVRDFDSINFSVKGCSKVLHLAALIAIPYSYRSPRSYIDTNIHGTYNVLQAAKENFIKKVVHTSTSEVYGSAQYVPINEKHPLVGQSPYSASKIGADQIAIAYNRSFDIPLIIVRPFNTFGPRQSLRAIIPTIITQLLNNKKHIYLGNLKPTRDFIFVEDVCKGFLCAMNSKVKNGSVFNIGSGREVSIGSLIKKIKKITKSKILIKKDSKRIRPLNSEVDRLLASSNRAKKILKWKPYYTGVAGFEKALKKTIDWYKKEENLSKFNAKKYNI